MYFEHIERVYNMTRSITNESAFFDHIALQINKLTTVYSNILQEISHTDLEVSAASVNYAMMIQRLNRAINYFKNEMKECLNDYTYMKNANIFRDGYSMTHIKSELDALYTEHELFSTNVPENDLKQGLGRNFYFHKNIRKLTPETILEYFEMNYTLKLEQ